MDHSAISKTLWAFFPWLSAGFAALGIIFPVSLAFAAGVLSLMAMTATGLSGIRAALIENKGMAGWAVGLCALCFFSVIFSIAPQESAERAAKITALIILSLPVLVLARRIPAAVRDKLLRLLPVAVMASGIILAIELYWNFPLYKILSGEGDVLMPLYVANKNVAAFTLLLPAGLYAALKCGRRGIAGMLGIVAAAIFFKTESQAAQCAMVGMIFVGAGMMVCRRLTIHGVFAAIAVLLLTFPFFSQAAMEHMAEPVSRYEQSVLGGATAAMRLENYSFISKRILESPIKGHGIDTARHMTFETEEKYFKGNTILHPHNIYLQIWLEFGAYGAAFFLGFLAFIWKSLRQASGSAQSVRVIFFCMLMAFLSISWSMWASWLVGMIIFFSAMVRLMTAQSDG